MAGERSAILEYFRSVDQGDFIALPPNRNRYEQDFGHDEARAIARERGIEHPHWVFWHRQAAWVFDSNGDLIDGLRINWGGDHARVLEVLSGIPAPFRVHDGGPGAVFVITSDHTAERAAEPFPAPDDTVAVKDRIRRITAPTDRRRPTAWTAAERQWMQSVLVHGDVAAQGAVVAWIIRWEGLTAEALDAVMANWTRIYAKTPSWALITDLLRLLNRRADPRLEAVIDESMKRKNWTFRGGVSGYLANRADADDIPRLYELARVPGRYEHTPGNALALRGWVAARALHEGRSAAEVAAEALDDDAFDVAARRELTKIAETPSR